MDGNLYSMGVEVWDADTQATDITRDAFHGEWRDGIGPQQQPL